MNWIEIVIFIIVFLFPVISKILGGDDQAKPKPARRQPRPQPPVRPKNVPQGSQPGAGQRAGGQPAGQNALENEIEEFLRRARGGGKQGGKPKTNPQPQPQPVVREKKQKVRRLSDAPKSIKERQGRPQHDDLGERESVAEHVDRHIKSHPVTEHSKTLGAELGHADESMEEHLHEVFDHDVGSLTHGQVSGEIPEGTDAAVWETSESKRQRKNEAAKQRTQDVLEMLRNPESIQQAIILGEVLNRPNFD